MSLGEMLEQIVAVQPGSMSVAKVETQLRRQSLKERILWRVNRGGPLAAAKIIVLMDNFKSCKLMASFFGMLQK
jgi:hypothetical protein